MNKIITPVGVCSYPHIWEPQAPPGSAKKLYSVAIIFPDDQDLSAIEDAAQATLTEAFGPKASFGRYYRYPIRTDGADKGYPYSRFLNLKTESQPGVVGRYRGPDGRPLPLADRNELYPGALIRCSISPFAYDKSGNKGISFALNNLQVVDSSTPRLDGRLDPQDEFEALEDATEGDLDAQSVEEFL